MGSLNLSLFIRTLFTFGALSLSMSLGFAQSNFDDEVNAELDRMYSPSGAGSSQTVNVNVVKSGSVQKQPTTVIEASPVVESRAERIRRERQEVELATEQKIVEKLEQSRIEDEKRRMDKVFGDRMDGLNSSAPQGQPVVPAPVVVAAPAPVVVAEKQDKEEDKEPSTYLGLTAGVPGYADVGNIRPNYSAGFVIGRDLTNRLNFEGSFLFSNYEIRQPDGVVYLGASYPRLTNMDQLQGAVAIKGIFLDGRFRPNGGAILGFSHRTYRDTRIAINNNTANSQSVDWGLTAGFDVELTRKFAMGLDLRYLWNLTTRSSADNVVRPFGQLSNANPLEKLSYYQLLIAGKYYF